MFRYYFDYINKKSLTTFLPYGTDIEFNNEYLINQIFPSNFNSITIMFEIANHSYKTTVVNCNLVYKECRNINGTKIIEYYTFPLISDITNIGDYTVSFGGNSPLWQGYNFSRGVLFFQSSGISNYFSLKHMQVNYRG